MNTITQTIEARLPHSLSKEDDALLCRVATHYHQAYRSMISRKNQGGSINKNHFLKEFQLTSRQFNAIKGEVDGLFQSQLSNYKRYIDESIIKNNERKKRVKELNDLIQSCDKSDKQKLFKYHHELKGCYRKISRSQSNIKRWKKLIKEKRIRICLGSRELFKKQYELEVNGFDSHADWYNAFQSKRESEIVTLGSKDETNGNQTSSISLQENGKFTLKLRLPNAFEEKSIVLTDIAFSYRQEKLINALQANQIRSELKKGWKSNYELKLRHQRNLTALRERNAVIVQRMVERGDDFNKIAKAKESYEKKEAKFAVQSEGNMLCDFGQALSYRLKRDAKGWRVIISITSETDSELQTSICNGSIGIDLNEHHLAIAEMNSRGGKMQVFDLYFRKPGYSDGAKQVETGLGEAIKQVTDLAVSTQKPIVIENLDFSKAKSALSSGKNNTYNRMMSSLVTAKFLRILTLRCAEKGIEIIKVNAAYTSLIGRIKYGNETQFNVHHGAAMMIARRGMKLTDRHLPRMAHCRVRSELRGFTPPVDSVKIDLFSFYRKVKSKYDAWFDEMWQASLEASKLKLKQSCLTEEVLIF